MKKNFLLPAIIALCFSLANAQAPLKFNYQGAARTSTGQPIVNQSVGLRFSILDLTATGTVVYSETQTATTNAFGLFNVAIGGGTVVSGTISGINWATGDKYMKVEMDPAGGTAYVVLGTSQLLTVPYSLRAEDAGAVTVYGSGTQNANKMVIQHSPAYPTWGLQYSDTLDQLRFLSAGTTVMNVQLGSNKVVVNGSLQIASGTPGTDKVLTSDATGNTTWQDFTTNVSAFQPTGCQQLASVTTTYQKIGDMGTFTKIASGTSVELDVQTNLYIGTLTSSSGAVYELRVDGIATTLGNATALIRTAGTFDPIIIIGVFTGLATGSHTISLWAKVTNSGTGTNAMWDAGCFNSAGTNNVLVKEFK